MRSELFAPHADSPLRTAQRPLISVPTPWLVRISSSSACSTRPSMMCTLFTPLRAASSAELIFGSMPPESVPSATSVVDLLGREAGQQLAVLVEHARRIGEQHQLFGLQDLGELAGDDVGVDVVGFAVLADADRRDHRDEVAGVEQRDQRRDRSDAISPTWPMSIRSLGLVLVLHHQLLGADEGAVLAGQADRLAAVPG